MCALKKKKIQFPHKSKQTLQPLKQEVGQHLIYFFQRLLCNVVLHVDHRENPSSSGEKCHDCAISRHYQQHLQISGLLCSGRTFSPTYIKRKPTGCGIKYSDSTGPIFSITIKVIQVRAEEHQWGESRTEKVRRFILWLWIHLIILKYLIAVIRNVSTMG